MAGKRPQTVADLMEDDRTLEELQSRQTGSEEAISDELTKLEQMMNDISGVTEGEIIYWLHRANDKNKSLHGAFLKRYPRETPYIDIHEEARDQYGGGDFVLLAKKDGIIYKKAWFPVEAPNRLKGDEPAQVKPPEDPFARLSGSIEKAMIFDRAASVMGNKVPVEVPKGVDPVMTMVSSLITGMQQQQTALQQQNTELLKLMLTKKEEPKGGNDALMEAIKLGVTISGGKVPMEEGEGGFLEILKGLAPYVPQIIAGFRGAPPAQPRPPVRVHPLPGAPAAPAAELPPSPAPPPADDARKLVMGRIMDELKFVLTLPPHPKLLDHVIDYIDTYMPDMVRQAEVVSGETFASYMVTLDPAFSEKKLFFLDLHAHLMSQSLEEIEPGEEITKVAEPF